MSNFQDGDEKSEPKKVISNDKDRFTYSMSEMSKRSQHLPAESSKRSRLQSFKGQAAQVIEFLSPARYSYLENQSERVASPKHDTILLKIELRKSSMD